MDIKNISVLLIKKFGQHTTLSDVMVQIINDYLRNPYQELLLRIKQLQYDSERPSGDSSLSVVIPYIGMITTQIMRINSSHKYTWYTLSTDRCRELLHRLHQLIQTIVDKGCSRISCYHNCSVCEERRQIASNVYECNTKRLQLLDKLVAKLK